MQTLSEHLSYLAGMPDSIHEFLAGLGQEGILGAIMVIIGIFAVFGIASKRFRYIAPALMTSLGILGTFCGIFLALHPLDFAPANMNESIRGLLNGMKTAFVTSLLGIASGISFRALVIPTVDRISALLTKTKAPPEQQGVLGRLDAIKKAIAEDDDASLAAQILGMRTEQQGVLGRLDAIKKAIAEDDDASLAAQILRMRTEQREVLERLDAIKQAIAGDDDASLVTQILRMRDENREGFKAIDDLAKTIRESLTEELKRLTDEIHNVVGEQLTKSLEKLIANIEEALIKQFGQTFVQFNEATLAIKRWQEDHRDQVEQLTEAFDLSSRNITQIAEDCRAIPDTLAQLQKIIRTADGEVAQLNKQLEAFAGMQQQAREAFPEIKRHLDEIGEDLGKSAEGFHGLKDTILKTLEDAEAETQRVAKQHAQNIQQMATSMQQELNTAHSKSAEVSAEIIEKSHKEFSKNIEAEVNRLVRAWGGNLVSIAEKAQEAINAVNDRR